jgi:phenylpropionate dioxygenase-like ring-hydroxylating dioxygenase large terminal subunit
MSYLRNCWYPAAPASWLKRGELQRRVILGQGLVFFRNPAGRAFALRDRCPHRFAQLSMGKLLEERVRCIYHGLEFAFDGKCASNPHGDRRIPDGIAVRGFPVEERHGFIWLWTGDQVSQDVSRIPDLQALDIAATTATVWGSDRTPVNYFLSQDNLMDFSHVDHLHTAFDSSGISGAVTKVKTATDSVTILWEWDAEAPFFPFRSFMPQTPVRSWTEVTWHPPATVVVNLGSTPLGRIREQGCYNFGVHALCPETETTTHHNYGLRRNFALDNTELTRLSIEALIAVNLTEDVPMVRGCQEEMAGEDLLDLQPMLLQNDKGVMVARRRLARMIREEQKALNQSPVNKSSLRRTASPSVPARGGTG